MKYLVDTDYVVDYQMGMVMPTQTGAVVLGESLKVTFDHNAVSGHKISGAVKRTIRGGVRLRGVNIASGKPIQVYIPLTTLFPSGGVDLMAENFAQFPLKGNPTLGDGETAPYYVESLN